MFKHYVFIQRGLSTVIFFFDLPFRHQEKVAPTAHCSFQRRGGTFKMAYILKQLISNSLSLFVSFVAFSRFIMRISRLYEIK